MVKDETSEHTTNSAGNGKDEQFRKLFIGGLSMQTTDESLHTFYSQYGAVADCVVMKDSTTRRSRGFGFVTYETIEAVDAAMNARPHVVDGKTVDPKRAVPREASQKNEANMSTKRLYVSGVRDDMTEEMFTDYFVKYGDVEKVEIIKDKNTGKLRGFGFITFNDYDPVDKCTLERSHMINGHRCDVKKALSKEEIAKAHQMERDRAERSQRSRGSGGRSGWGGGGHGGGDGRGPNWMPAPQWGPPSGYPAATPWAQGPPQGYGSYPVSGRDGPWAAAPVNDVGPTPWQHGGGGGAWQSQGAYPPAGPAPGGWGAPPQSSGGPGWGGPMNQRPY